MLVCLLWTGAAWSQQAWVRQTDLDLGLIYDLPLEPDGGTFTTPLPVTESGSLFELFSRGSAWDNNIYLLDTKIIHAYTPQVAVQITSEDPYVRGDPASGNYVKRTRVDRPFNVSISVNGLVPASTSPAERELYFACQGCNYDPTTFSGLGQETYLIHETNLGNGDVTLGPLYSELTTPTLSGTCGSQTYTFIRYAADGIDDTILAQPKIEIWPLASATVDNIHSGQVFIDRIPTLVVNLQRLYPDSRTYAQVYEGQAALGTAGTIVHGSERRFGRHYNPDLTEEPTNVPQNVMLSIDDLSNYASADGIYTLEILTETPFFNRAPERLFVVTFEVDRVISSRGQISTAEKSQP